MQVEFLENLWTTKGSCHTQTYTFFLNFFLIKQICAMHRSYKKMAMLIANINLVTVVTIQKQYKDNDNSKDVTYS